MSEGSVGGGTGEASVGIPGARALSADRRWADAARAYQELLAVPGEHRSALMSEAGRALFKAGRYQDALTPLSEAVLANPADRKSARRLALAVLALGPGTASANAIGSSAARSELPGARPINGETTTDSGFRRLIETPEPELCGLVLSEARGRVYRSALAGLATGRFRVPERSAESEILEKLVVASHLHSVLGTLDPGRSFESLDDMILALLRSPRGYLVIVYAMSNTGSAHLNFSLLDSNKYNENVIVTFHNYYSNIIRLSDPKIRKACIIKHCLRFGKFSDVKLKIVSLVRDPISRLFSAYMYAEIRGKKLKEVTKSLLDGATIAEDVWLSMSNQFEARVIHAMREDYFASEIGHASGIDIYASPVDLSEGYAVIRQGSQDLLLLRTERMEGCAARAFKEFLGQDVKMVPANDPRVSRTRMRDNPLYTAFQSKVRLRASLFDELYGLPWVRHLFSPKEVDEVRARWQGNLV